MSSDSHIDSSAKKRDKVKTIVVILLAIFAGVSYFKQQTPPTVNVAVHYYEAPKTAVVCLQANDCYPIAPFPAGEISPIPARQVVSRPAGYCADGQPYYNHSDRRFCSGEVTGVTSWKMFVKNVTGWL